MRPVRWSTCSAASSRRTWRAQWNNATIVFESKSGANGSIAAEDVARAAPDGYTWLLVTTFFTASPALYNELRWDPQRDFIPVGEICRAPNVFIVPASLPVKNVAEFVALAKSKPGTLTYGHPGKGSTGHLGFELFKRARRHRRHRRRLSRLSADGRRTSRRAGQLELLLGEPGAGQVQTGAIRIIGDHQ